MNSKRQQEVLCLLGSGKIGKEIAQELGISVKTVEFHRAALIKKHGFRTWSAVQMAHYCLHHKLIKNNYDKK